MTGCMRWSACSNIVSEFVEKIMKPRDIGVIALVNVKIEVTGYYNVGAVSVRIL